MYARELINMTGDQLDQIGVDRIGIITSFGIDVEVDVERLDGSCKTYQLDDEVPVTARIIRDPWTFRAWTE